MKQKIHDCFCFSFHLHLVPVPVPTHPTNTWRENPNENVWKRIPVEEMEMIMAVASILFCIPGIYITNKFENYHMSDGN